jgi:hypothetical protein
MEYIVIVLYFKCLAALFIGLAIHTISKYLEAAEIHNVGNVGDLHFREFIMKKPLAHILNVLCSLLWLIFLPDVIKAYPEIKGSVYLANILHIAICAIAGWANSSIILKALGTGTKYALDVIDKKTNIADSK